MIGLDPKNPRHTRLIAWLRHCDATLTVSFRDGSILWNVMRANGMAFVISVDGFGGWNIYTGLPINDVGRSIHDAENRLNQDPAPLRAEPSRLAKANESAMGPARGDAYQAASLPLTIPPRHGKTSGPPYAIPIDGSTPACIAPEYDERLEHDERDVIGWRPSDGVIGWRPRDGVK